MNEKTEKKKEKRKGKVKFEFNRREFLIQFCHHLLFGHGDKVIQIYTSG